MGRCDYSDENLLPPRLAIDPGRLETDLLGSPSASTASMVGFLNLVILPFDNVNDRAIFLPGWKSTLDGVNPTCLRSHRYEVFRP